MSQVSKYYLPNLDGLRFLAAMLVILHHISPIAGYMGIDVVFNNDFTKVAGKLGVTLFFVLSGFLITKLLIKEKAETKKIHVFKFYIRRVLRIWPLYYLLAFLSLFVFPQLAFFQLNIPSAQSEFLKLFLYLGLLPNVALALFIKVPFATVLWSVGVEEQFYAIWPWLVKKAKDIKMSIFLILVFYILLRAAFEFMGDSSYLGIFEQIIDSFMLSSLAIGALAAVYSTDIKAGITKLFNPYLQILTYGLVFFLIGTGARLGFFHYEIYALLFSVIILNLSMNKNSVLTLESFILKYLGRISYGLYLWHSIAIFLSFKLIYQGTNIQNEILAICLSIALSIILSALSYELFERQFLKIKAKYQIFSK